MLTIISPAKRLDFSPQTIITEATKPALLTQARQLVDLLHKKSPKQIGKLMGVSDKLAAEVHTYFRDWKMKYDAVGAKQAILAYRGDVYQGMDVDSFTADDFEYAQSHLRILSGLYGVVRPLDLIQPYRLEMGLPLSGKHGKDLYDFWEDRISRQLLKTLAEQDDHVLINLASNEYVKAVQAESMTCRVVTPVFKDFNRGQYRVLSFFAKKARGLMVRHLIRKKVSDIAGIRRFRSAGYKFNRDLSTDDQLVFTRDKPPG